MAIQVTLPIPEKITQACIACGFTEDQTKNVFLAYMEELTNHPYNQFEIDFETWLDGDAQDYLEEILKR